LETEKTWLNAFEGQHITVTTPMGNDERAETGTLLKIGDGWVHIVKDNGDMLLIPISAIRVVKLLDMTHSYPALEKDNLPPLSMRIYEPNAQTL
jgi:hypothetical protein